MARNAPAAKNYRQFAQIFLDESRRLDDLRATNRSPQKHVASVWHTSLSATGVAAGTGDGARHEGR